MIREWLDTQEVVAFAQGIAKELDRLFPSTEVPKQKTISPKKEQKKLDSVALRTRAFADGHKLNVYKKAKLLNTIKWELRDAGHEEALIDEIIAFLTPLLTSSG